MITLTNQTLVTDPCYSQGESNTNTLNTKAGEWFVEIEISDEGNWGERVSELSITHKGSETDYTLIKEEDFSVSVDSGQAGFFVLNQVPDEDIEEEEFEEFYDKVCDMTLSSEQYGFGDFGVVSSTGFGDGCYTCYTGENKEGEVVFAKIVFISENDE